MSRQVIQTEHAPAAVGTYSQAIKAGNTIYISGQIGLNPTTMQLADGFEAQAKQVLDNIEAICKAAGASLADVVKYNVSLTNLVDFAALNELFVARLPTPYPARAAVQVTALPKGAVVEIEAIVYLDA